MKLRQIVYTLEVAKTQSINQAAKNLFVAQPHLSATIAELEHSLQITIFKRTSKGVVPTAVGREFIQSCQYIMDQIAYMENLHDSHNFCETAHLSIVANCHNSIANDLFIQLQKENSEKTTHFFFKILDSLSIIQQISNLTYNIGLLLIPAMELVALEGILKTNKLEFHPIINENFTVMLSQHNPLYTASCITDEACHQFPLVLLDDNWERSVNAFRLYNFHHTITVDDKESFFHTVLKTDTIAIALKSINATNSYVEMDLLHFIPFDYYERHNYCVIGWLQRQNAQLTSLEQLFLTRYQAHFASFA